MACLDVEVAVVRVAVVVVVEDDVDALGEPGESHDGEQLHKQHHLLPRLLTMNLNCFMTSLGVLCQILSDGLGPLDNSRKWKLQTTCICLLNSTSLLRSVRTYLADGRRVSGSLPLPRRRLEAVRILQCTLDNNS